MGEVAKRLPDSSEYYVGDRATQEEVNWLLAGHYRQNAAAIVQKATAFGIQSVIDFGCGSGLVALDIPPSIKYTGIDKNEAFLKKAWARFDGWPNRKFICFCVRNYEGEACDLACCFGLLKHFALDEFHVVLGKVLQHGRYGLFNMQVRGSELDNGEKFHHAYVCEDRVRNAIEVAGHVEIERSVVSEWVVDNMPVRDVLIWTKKKEAVVTPEDVLAKEDLGVTEDVPKAEVSVSYDTPQEVPQPHQNRQSLMLDGKIVRDLRDYSLRWNGLAGKEQPTLYKDGKRVVLSWSMSLDVVMEKDTKGASA